jgi:hypothetical protein
MRRRLNAHDIPTEMARETSCVLRPVTCFMNAPNRSTDSLTDTEVPTLRLRKCSFRS